MALTDHDTLAGVAEAVRTGVALGVRVIPGVEISASTARRAWALSTLGKRGLVLFSPGPEGEAADAKVESVHVLAYFGAAGPAGGAGAEFGRRLAGIRRGRLDRARAMVAKLQSLGVPVELDRVLQIAGPGVAPGRPHVAAALLEAGHVASSQEAFTKYIGDKGPAYASGAELPAEEAVEMIGRAGGVAVLAHPWSLRSAVAVTASLVAAGLHGIEVYKASEKLADYASLADAHGLLKVGGSDFHGRDSAKETDIGRFKFPAPAAESFLRSAMAVWDGPDGATGRP
eukprot:jgi/Mesen1/8101/ME000434S07346